MSLKQWVSRMCWTCNNGACHSLAGALKDRLGHCIGRLTFIHGINAILCGSIPCHNGVTLTVLIKVREIP